MSMLEMVAPMSSYQQQDQQSTTKKKQNNSMSSLDKQIAIYKSSRRLDTDRRSSKMQTKQNTKLPTSKPKKEQTSFRTTSKTQPHLPQLQKQQQLAQQKAEKQQAIRQRLQSMTKSEKRLDQWKTIMNMILAVPLDHTVRSIPLDVNPTNRFRVWTAMIDIANEMLDTNLYSNLDTQQKDKYLQVIKKNHVFDDEMYAKNMDIYAYFRGIINYTGNMPQKDQFFTLHVEGVRCVSRAFVRTIKSQQTILFLGEHHEITTGNTPQILETLVRELDCPIDVLAEKPYDLGISVPPENNALMSYFRKLSWSKCFVKGFVPKQTLLADYPEYNKEYFEKCVEPFQGKVKFWGIDIRQMSWFRWFLLKFYKDKKKDPSVLISHAKELFCRMLDYDAYLKDPVAYDKSIKEGYTALFNELISTYTLPEDKIAQFKQRFLQKEPSHEKDHMKLMKSVSYLSYPIAKYICDMVRNNVKESFETSLFVRYLQDIYTFLRIVRLVREDKNRMIVLFVGANHIDMLKAFFRNCPDLSYQSDPPQFTPPHVDMVSYNYEAEVEATVDLKLKKMPPSQTTRMIAYNNMKKKTSSSSFST